MKIAITFLSLWISLSVANAQPAPSYTYLHVRTNLVDGNIIAVTNDGRFFMITCNYSLNPVSGKNYATLFGQNEDGDIRSPEFHKENRHVARKKSQGIPLALSAVGIVCRAPNGLYQLRIKRQGDFQEVEYVSGESLDAANVDRRDRKY